VVTFCLHVGCHAEIGGPAVKAFRGNRLTGLMIMDFPHPRKVIQREEIPLRMLKSEEQSAEENPHMENGIPLTRIGLLITLLCSSGPAL